MESEQKGQIFYQYNDMASSEKRKMSWNAHHSTQNDPFLPILAGVFARSFSWCVRSRGNDLNLVLKHLFFFLAGSVDSSRIRLHHLKICAFFVGYNHKCGGKGTLRYVYLPSRANHQDTLLRGAILIRTRHIHKNLYITLFLLIIVGPYYYVPP